MQKTEPLQNNEDRDAGKSLELCELRYEQLISFLPEAIYTTDISGKLLIYNQKAVELWGRAPVVGVEQWCGSWKILETDRTVVPIDKYPVALTLKKGVSEEPRELVVVRPNGEERRAVAHPHPLRDAEGKIIGAMNMMVDVTEVRRTEAALRKSENSLLIFNASLEKLIDERTAQLKQANEEIKKSEERYHRMVEQVEDYAILLLDKNGFIQNWNTGAQKIKGYTESEIVGKNFRIFYLPEDRDSGLPEKLIERAVATGKAIHEGWRMRKDGTLFWGSIVITALHDDNNEIMGFTKVTRDLSDRKLAEDKIREYAKELEFQNKELEQFAYAASHDMKEPLRKIMFYNNFVMEKYASELDGKGADYLGRAINAAKRMQQLIDDILAYSRTTVEKESFEKIDLNEIAKELMLQYKEEDHLLNVQLIFEPLPVINGISYQVRQILSNLVENAVKYRHPDRSPVIRISSDKVKGSSIPNPESLSKQWYHRVVIADNGIGFEQEHANKIFELFQRLHSKSVYPGSGIGLAVCKKLMQYHGGFIMAKGVPNEGATFELYFPMETDGGRA